MKIRVATDISILGNRFDSFDPKHGIYNVIEEVMTEVCKREDVEMTAVGLCGDDPLAASIKALLYLEHKKPGLSCGFKHTFRILPGLTKLYTKVFYATLSGKLERLPSGSARQVLLRSARALLYRMSYNYRLVPPRRVFDYKSFDVFHCPHPALPPRAATGNLPRVITIYDLIPVIRPDFVTKRISDDFKRNLDQIDVNKDWVVCISEFTRQEFCAYTAMSPERVQVAPLAPASYCRPISDPQALAAARARHGVPEGQYFLSLAAPQPRKNLTHLIGSFFRLLDETPSADIYLVLAGSKEQGWMYEKIFAAAENSSAHRPRIIFAGYVADDDLAALYSGALAFVFPSLYEGFGLPPLEAMACGAPVITANNSSLPEVVGNAGLMVDPLDEAALCQAMQDVLADASLRQALKRRGLERARTFSWQKCADKTVQVYKSAAAEGRPA